MDATQFLLILVAANFVTSSEHSGAYSSPQYAKKFYPKNYDSTAFLPNEKQPVVFNNQEIDRYDGDLNDTSSYARSSFLDVAGNFLSGTGGQVVSSLAKDFIARSTGSSQVGFDCISQVRIALRISNCTHSLLASEIRQAAFNMTHDGIVTFS